MIVVAVLTLAFLPGAVGGPLALGFNRTLATLYGLIALALIAGAVYAFYRWWQSEEQTVAPRLNVCPGCSGEVSERWKVCPNCGHDLRELRQHEDAAARDPPRTPAHKPGARNGTLCEAPGTPIRDG